VKDDQHAFLLLGRHGGCSLSQEQLQVVMVERDAQKILVVV
jgi:hypothetical protein